MTDSQPMIGHPSSETAMMFQKGRALSPLATLRYPDKLPQSTLEPLAPLITHSCRLKVSKGKRLAMTLTPALTLCSKCPGDTRSLSCFGKDHPTSGVGWIKSKTCVWLANSFLTEA